MFSALGDIFVPKPRQAETTDTRLGIRHHDPEYEHRKKKKRESDTPFGFDEDDNAIVSIEALQLFLENFLKSPAASKKEIAPPNKIVEAHIQAQAEKQAPDHAPSGQAAMASNAYQHGAETRRANGPDMPDSGEATSSENLGAEDVRIIHRLLNDLNILADRSVSYLRIERGESFLQSLADAVAKAK